MGKTYQKNAKRAQDREAIMRSGGGAHVKRNKAIRKKHRDVLKKTRKNLENDIDDITYVEVD